MSPRHNNRDALLEGAIQCLQERGYAGTRARDIAAAADAGLASIGYHFGSTEALLGEALTEAFTRWFAEYAKAVATDHQETTKSPIDRAANALHASLEQNQGMALAFVEALAQAPRSEPLRAALADIYAQGRQAVAVLFNLPRDGSEEAVASVMMAIFDGLLIQAILDPDGVPDADRVTAAIKRIGSLA